MNAKERQLLERKIELAKQGLDDSLRELKEGIDRMDKIIDRMLSAF